MLSGRDFSESI